jgi:hypothetical protein
MHFYFVSKEKSKKLSEKEKKMFILSFCERRKEEKEAL